MAHMYDRSSFMDHMQEEIFGGYYDFSRYVRAGIKGIRTTVILHDV